MSEGSILCEWCRLEHIRPVPSRCVRCHKMTTDSRVCSSCRSSLPLLHAWVCADYKGVAKDLVQAAKFESKLQAVEVMARSMAESLPYVRPSYLLVPVPTATMRRRQRGYDHAEKLSQHLASLLGLQHCSVVRRIGQARQVGSDKQTRSEQLKGVFWVEQPELIAGKDIIIVDDVTSTTATLIEVAKVLRSAGAKTVSAAVFAQKV
jgi:competence protein ComFC